MYNLEISQQITLFEIKGEDEELFKKGLLYFFMLRKLYEQTVTSFIEFKNINEQTEENPENNILFNEISKNIKKIYEKYVTKNVQENMLPILIPIKNTTTTKRIKNLNSNLDLKISNNSNNIFFSLEHDKANGYKIRIKTYETNENKQNSELTDFSLVNLYEDYLDKDDDDDDEQETSEMNEEVFVFLWFCWLFSENFPDFSIDKWNVENNKTLSPNIFNLLNNIKEYIGIINEKIESKKNVLSFENFLETNTSLNDFCDKMFNFYKKYNTVYEQCLLSQSDILCENPLEFKHLDKQVEKATEELINFIISSNPLQKTEPKTNSDISYPFWEIDLDIFLNQYIPEFSKVKINPFNNSYFTGISKEWATHSSFFYLKIIDPDKYEKNENINIVTGKGGKIRKQNEELEEIFIKNTSHKIIKEEINPFSKIPRNLSQLEQSKFCNRSLFTDKIYFSNFSYFDDTINNTYFLSNIFLDGNIISQKNIKDTYFRDCTEHSIIHIDWIRGREPMFKEFLLNGEHTIFFSHGKYEDTFLKNDDNESDEIIEMPEDEYKNKIEYSQAEALFYSTMNFLYKYSKFLESKENTIKESLILEMEEEIKALLEVYNFVEALKDLSMPYVLINRL